MDLEKRLHEEIVGIINHELGETRGTADKLAAAITHMLGIESGQSFLTLDDRSQLTADVAELTTAAMRYGTALGENASEEAKARTQNALLERGTAIHARLDRVTPEAGGGA